MFLLYLILKCLIQKNIITILFIIFRFFQAIQTLYPTISNTCSSIAVLVTNTQHGEAVKKLLNNLKLTNNELCLSAKRQVVKLTESLENKKKIIERLNNEVQSLKNEICQEQMFDQLLSNTLTAECDKFTEQTTNHHISLFDQIISKTSTSDTDKKH